MPFKDSYFFYSEKYVGCCYRGLSRLFKMLGIKAMLEETTVFVYGTLKQNMKNHSVMERIKGKFQFPAKTIKLYPMFDLGDGFPYLQDKEDIGYIIQGEIFKVPTENMKTLDYFEGVPNLYKKGMIEVEFKGNTIKADCYFISDELSELEIQNVELLSNWEERC